MGDGDSIGIGAEALHLCVAFVGGAVLHSDLEKQMSHFPQRTTVYGGGEFFGDAGRFRHVPPHEPRDKVHAPLEHEIFPFRCDGRFEVADAGIELLQADCLGRLRVPQCVHLGRVQARRKDHLVGVEPPGKVLLQFLRRGESLFPPFVFPLEA
jgi:hypothetical protein